MKLTNTRNLKRKSGMTLLELTVVILVLLSLISILFIGARAWKKGSDRAANILNVRNVQQAVRAHANVRGLNAGDALPNNDVFGIAAAEGVAGTDGYLKRPTPPTGTYTYKTVVPSIAAATDSATVNARLYISNPDLAQGDGEYWYSATEVVGKAGDW